MEGEIVSENSSGAMIARTTTRHGSELRSVSHVTLL